MDSYNKKKEYNRKWTQDFTKSVTIRLNKEDEVWKMIEELKTNGVKLNAIFKEAVIREYNNLKQ